MVSGGPRVWEGLAVRFGLAQLRKMLERQKKQKSAHRIPVIPSYLSMFILICLNISRYFTKTKIELFLKNSIHLNIVIFKNTNFPKKNRKYIIFKRDKYIYIAF